MLDLALYVLAVLACGALDYLRGRYDPSLLYVGLNAALLALPLVGGPVEWGAAVVIVLFVLGSSPGWGEPWGAALVGGPMHPSLLEWWQVGPLKRHTYLALVARGLIWSPTMAVAMPAAAALGYVLGRRLGWDVTTRWRVAEGVRGAVNAALWYSAIALCPVL